MATQSAALVNQFNPEDIIIADFHAGASTLTRLSPESLEEWLTRYSLGELWEKNLLGGRP